MTTWNGKLMPNKSRAKMGADEIRVNGARSKQHTLTGQEAAGKLEDCEPLLRPSLVFSQLGFDCVNHLV